MTVTAGGCVQTGGAGATWKRYVNPSGPNADRLYRGLILVKGATNGLIPIEQALGRTLVVVDSKVDTPLFELGYQDDDYGDNGYYSHDDGTEDQCRDVGPAWVALVIRRPAPARAAAVSPAARRKPAVRDTSKP